jgi:putative MATE family efflux protein
MEQTVAEKKSPFATEPVGKLIVKFAIPCVISLVVNALYNIVDQIFIGWGVGYLGNGATNVVFPITIIALALAVLVGDGGAAYLSLKLGEGDLKSVKKGVGNALIMVTIAGVAMLVITLIFMDPILTLFGATDKLRVYAFDYGYIIAIGLPFTMISTALNAMIRADGSPKFAMMSMLLGAIINTILDPVFIFVFHMGVQGAAIATILGQIASFVVSITYLPRFKTIKIDRHALALSGRTCKSVLSLGVSSFITQIAITIVMALFNNLLVSYGAASVYGAEIPLTAMGIVMKVNQIMLSILVGIAIGAQPVIGFNYGCKNYARVKRAFEVAIFAAEVIAVLAFLLFQFAPMAVVSLFGSEEGLYNEFAVKCFRIFLLLCPFNGFQTVAAIYLQAIGKPVKSAIVTLSRQIVFLVPFALLLPKLLGVVGVLWAGPVADTLAFILALILILYEMKKLKASPVNTMKA